MLTPESFTVCFIGLVMLAFFHEENRHEETMEKFKRDKDSEKGNEKDGIQS